MATPPTKINREIPAAEPVRPLELTNYQEGALVSRTLITEALGQ